MSIAKNHRKIPFAAERCGISHHGGAVSAIACRAPSRRFHDGGRGSSRPARRWNTGSMNMPRNDAAGPAIAMWIHIGNRPTIPPTATAARASRCVTTNQPRTSPTAIARSGRYVSARPARVAPTNQHKRCRRGSSTCTPRTTNTALHNVDARPPFHAIAVRPIGVRM